MIEISELIKTMGEKTILKNINFNVKNGETVAILGPNGAGKSTILKILSGLLKPTSGTIKINNLDFKVNKLDIKKKIGFLAHNSYLYDHFSPMENLQFFARLYQVTDIEKKAKQVIHEVGLGFFINEPVGTFSRGMIQRLAIARAIIHSPQLLLLDEPYNGLDQQGKRLLTNIILKMKGKGATIVVVTHDIRQAVEISDRIIIIKTGQLIDSFPIEEKNTGRVIEKYMRLVEEK